MQNLLQKDHKLGAGQNMDKRPSCQFNAWVEHPTGVYRGRSLESLLERHFFHMSFSRSIDLNDMREITGTKRFLPKGFELGTTLSYPIRSIRLSTTECQGR